MFLQDSGQSLSVLARFSRVMCMKTQISRWVMFRAAQLSWARQYHSPRRSEAVTRRPATKQRHMPRQAIAALMRPVFRKARKAARPARQHLCRLGVKARLSPRPILAIQKRSMSQIRLSPARRQRPSLQPSKPCRTAMAAAKRPNSPWRGCANDRTFCIAPARAVCAPSPLARYDAAQ